MLSDEADRLECVGARANELARSIPMGVPHEDGVSDPAKRVQWSLKLSHIVKHLTKQLMAETTSK